MKQFFTSVFVLLCSVFGLAQTQDFPSSEEGILLEANTTNLLNSESTILSIPLKFHLIVSSSSALSDTGFIETLLTEANDRFLGADVQFYKCGSVNMILDPAFADGRDPFTIRSNFHSTHGDSNVINMYIPNSTTMYGGFSFSGPNGATGYNVMHNAIVFDKSQYIGGDKMLPSHELGHYFGLYHPSANSSGMELVDGSNCTVAGDFCCDTPAEYGNMCCAVLPDCTYSPLFGVVMDSNGDTLMPDVTNIMSSMQFNMNCRDVFTDDQYERIKFYKDNYLSNLECSYNIGIREIEQADFVIAPNPAKESIHITVSASVSSYTVSIYDISGLIVHKSHMLYEPQYTCNTSALNSGAYIVHLNSAMGTTKSVLIVE